MTGPAPYHLTRLFFQRSLALIYFFAFLVTAHQFTALCGTHGLLPAAAFLDRIRFWDSPSLFYFHYSDAAASVLAWTGVCLALVAFSGLSERAGAWVSAAVWSLLWLIYLSFVNIGQVFYSFGWETLLLETGFLAVFLGSRDTRPPVVVIWLLRWLLFRLMFGAGLIKLRGDSCWRDLTAMFYHYETQPMPNPLSWYFHHLPQWVHRCETLFTHFVEIVIPWAYFAPRRLRHTAGILTVLFQSVLILSGNLSWLNYLTITLAVACFDDRFWSMRVRRHTPETKNPSRARTVILTALTLLVAVLSIQPARNLISPRQLMNASFEPLHLVNTYGAFGTITRERREIVLEGTEEAEIRPDTLWKEYEFKGKPGDIHETPPVIAPYHLRLDWLLWFAAMSRWQHYPWLLNLTAKLLEADPAVLDLVQKDPFGGRRPSFVRISLYRYRFTTGDERRTSGDTWVRERLGEYLPPLSLDHPVLRRVREILGWE